MNDGQLPAGYPDNVINHDANYRFVKEWLRRGDVLKLAAKYRINRSTAYKVLRGRSRNYEFLKACYDLAYERALTFKLLDDKLHTL